MSLAATAPASVPTGAECLDIAQCVKAVTRPSEFMKGQNVTVIRFFCPACDHESPDPGSLHSATCDCGLHYRVDGSTVWVWRNSTRRFAGAAR